MENKVYMNLANLFEDDSIQSIKVPAYQRAYSWEEKQLEQFIGDVLEIREKKGYYFGHFIFEKENNSLYIIDGQQRITTYILFLITCDTLTNSSKFKTIINKFCTVDYDENNFSHLKNQAAQNLEITKTISISRMEFAINYFEKLFQSKKLQIEKIEDYVNTLKNAHISTHITVDKAVAVQIFELHNSRGVKLNTIEKVKSKLMKALYLNAELGEVDEIINDVQKSFGEIYHLEEKTSLTSFRGNLSLEEILLIHLRMIDDGTKIKNPEREQVFNSPSKNGNREENILNYLDEKLKNIEKENIATYIEKLVKKFEESVRFIVIEVPEMDIKNELIGDSIILERNYTLSFLLILSHLKELNKLQNELLTSWEKLLFTRDLHDKYKGLWYTDNFEYLFFLISKDVQNVCDLIKKFEIEGFRSNKFLLNKEVTEYLIQNKNSIINSAYYWHKEKMIYLLYKYEIHLQSESRKHLREIMKNGVSVEHILPQEWQWEWTSLNDYKSIEAKEFYDKIEKVKNGIGNLLIITPSQNSSLSNSRPNDKKYNRELGISYQNHNESKMWDDCNNWETNILNRGEKILGFLFEFLEK